MVRVGDDTAETGSFLCRPGTGYRTRTGKTCCPASNIRQDNLHSWFRADARLSSMSGGVASISLRLYFRYVFNERVEWRPLRWELLSEMHGRRVHVSAASTDLRYAWHVHPDAASLAPNAADLPIQLRLPDGAGSTPLTVRLHASFGVRAWDPAIQMCIDSEDVVHVDPGRGQEMLVEGEALTNPVTLTPAGHSRPRPEPPLVAALSADRRLVTLRLGGRGADEIEDAAAISRDLEAPCNQQPQPQPPQQLRQPPPPEQCWRARLVAGALDATAFGALQADIATGHRLAGALFGEARSQVPAEAAAHAQRPLIAPACVGLNLYVRSADGSPATGKLHSSPALDAGCTSFALRSERMRHQSHRMGPVLMAPVLACVQCRRRRPQSSLPCLHTAGTFTALTPRTAGTSRWAPTPSLRGEAARRCGTSTSARPRPSATAAREGGEGRASPSRCPGRGSPLLSDPPTAVPTGRASRSRSPGATPLSPACAASGRWRRRLHSGPRSPARGPAGLPLASSVSSRLCA